MNDLKIIDLPFFNQNEIQTHSRPVGKVLNATQYLRRRSINSILWEDSKPDDTLFLNDSVLTLEKSNATLQLQEKSEIFLSENTLIVLEPTDTKAPDELRVKFNHGEMHSRNVASTTVIMAPSWTMQVEKGAEVKVRSMPGEKLEVELLKGKLQVQGEKEKRSFDEGQVILLNKENAESMPISSKLGWTIGKENTFRVYGHNFPQTVWLSWGGSAKSLRLTTPDKDSSEYPLQASQERFPLQLKPGSYEARLIADNAVSPTLSIQVWQAPPLHLLSPHPRDRFTSSTDVLFSWITAAVIPKYQLEMAHDAEFSQVVLTRMSEQLQTNIKMPEQGSYFWRVQGVDDLGFKIPSLDANAIFSVKDPLSAPKLKVPEARAPANDNSALDYKKILKSIFDLLIPSAEAREESFEAVFQWEAVDGADFYNIEIDTKPDFQNPVLVEKTKLPQFVWNKATVGTFYWRVSAGANDRMGLFSEAAEFKLTKPTRSSQEVAPGVKIRKPKYEPPPPPPPVVAVLEPTPTPAPTPTPEPARPGRYDVWYGIGYDYSILAGDQSTTANLNGLSPLRLGLDFEVPIGQSASLVVDANYQRALWKPRDSVNLPYQDQIADSTTRGFVHYRGRPGALHFGLGAANVQTLKRDGLETVKLVPVSMVGPSFGLEWTQFENWEIGENFGLNFGQGMTEIASLSSVTRRVNLNDVTHLLLGVHTNLIFQRHTDGTNYRIQIGVFTGLEW